jgi:hypothetical protein
MTKSNPFAGRIDELRQHGELEQQKMATTSRSGAAKRQRSTVTFARIPHMLGLELYHHIGGPCWAILIELDRLILEARGRNPIELPNQRLQAIGINRTMKSYALRKLRTAGIITFEQRGRGISVVRHLWYPDKA